jgi:phosphoribosyl 1,2-cyclic phosphodiesterase/CheY-like chemotaxis protein
MTDSSTPFHTILALFSILWQTPWLRSRTLGKILVIDDDEILRALVSEVLGSHGHQIHAAADGEAGLALAFAERPDLIFLDLMMPKVHGYWVLEQIRANPDLKSTKVVVTSAKSYETDKRRAISIGADRYLVKPFEPADLVKIVGELLQNGSIRIKFWGTRGSIPAPGPDTVRYGGNTACVEIRHGEHILIFDAGSGIRILGTELTSEFGDRPLTVQLFISHTHWDHIQGFPFFAPAYAAGNRISIYSVHGAGKPLEKVFLGQMDGDYFPVLLSDMAAELKFFEMKDEVRIGPIVVDVEHLNHPGISVAFRVRVDGKCIVYMTDHEPFYRLHPGEFGERAEKRITEFARGADIYIREAQYTELEYAIKKGWGHSTFHDAVRTAAQAGVRRLVLFHHEPMHTDEFMDRMIDECGQMVRANHHTFECSAAKEGEVIDI